MNFINEGVCVYWHGTGGIYNCVNRLLHYVLCCASAPIWLFLFL